MTEITFDFLNDPSILSFVSDIEMLIFNWIVVQYEYIIYVFEVLAKLVFKKDRITELIIIVSFVLEQLSISVEIFALFKIIFLTLQNGHSLSTIRNALFIEELEFIKNMDLESFASQISINKLDLQVPLIIYNILGIFILIVIEFLMFFDLVYRFELILISIQ